MSQLPASAIAADLRSIGLRIATAIAREVEHEEERGDRGQGASVDMVRVAERVGFEARRHVTTAKAVAASSPKRSRQRVTSTRHRDEEQ